MTARKNARVSLRLPVSISLPTSSISRRAALSSDLSSTGFCLESPQLRAAGDEVTGFVLYGNKELTWTGRVAWVTAGNPMMSTWHRMGIEFTKVSPGLRALLSMSTR